MLCDKIMSFLRHTSDSDTTFAFTDFYKKFVYKVDKKRVYGLDKVTVLFQACVFIRQG